MEASTAGLSELPGERARGQPPALTVSTPCAVRSDRATRPEAGALRRGSPWGPRVVVVSVGGTRLVSQPRAACRECELSPPACFPSPAPTPGRSLRCAQGPDFAPREHLVSRSRKT